MADEQATEQDEGGTVYDAPNQQVVRADGSAPWDEGTGGSTSKKTRKKEKEKEPEQKQERAKDN